MLETSPSLLARVRAGSDPQGWNRLVELYAPLIQAWVRRYGLQAHDVDDLVQDVLVELHRALPEFHYDPSQGSFRGWLRTVTLNRMRVFWRLKKPIPIGGGNTDFPNQLNELADPHSNISKIWDREHDQFVTQRCLEMIQPDFEPQTWQAFLLVVQEGMPPDDAAQKLGMNRGAVYTAKSRVLARLREEVAGLID